MTSKSYIVGKCAATLVAALFLIPVTALADPAEGLWRTEADRKGQVGLVRISQCGATLCGKLITALDRDGKPVVTPAVGKRLFWDMSPKGGGSYEGGRVFVPLLKNNFEARMKLSGSAKIVLTGCNAVTCRNQTWVRVN